MMIAILDILTATGFVWVIALAVALTAGGIKYILTGNL